MLSWKMPDFHFRERVALWGNVAFDYTSVNRIVSASLMGFFVLGRGFPQPESIGR